MNRKLHHSPMLFAETLDSESVAVVMNASGKDHHIPLMEHTYDHVQQVLNTAAPLHVIKVAAI